MNQKHNPEMSLAEVEAEAHSLGLDIQDHIPKFTDEELDEYYAAVCSEGYWQAFCSQIHIPSDKNGQLKTALVSLPQDPRYRCAFERDDRHVTYYEKGYVLRMYRECLW